jgi:putative tryptophan/tyrosine transport system substrate-binding protein
MKRREFVAGLAGTAVTWPLAALAQRSEMPVVGFLNPTSPNTSADRLRAFQLGLKEGGYVEGENVTIACRWAESQNDRLPRLRLSGANRKTFAHFETYRF